MARPSRWNGQPFKGKRTETRKNGVKYIYEQLYQYDPVKKKTKVVGSTLIGKIMPGTDQIVRTRPKKPSKTALKRAKAQTGAMAISSANTAEDSIANKDTNAIATEASIKMYSESTANRIHIGVSEILDWVAKESGIGEDIRYSLPEGEALKALSLAYYLCATEATLPGFESWQLTHPIPYTNGISEENCYKLFSDIENNQLWVQSYFERRALRLSPNPALALDSTSISTYSEELNETRYGYCRVNDGLSVSKYCTLYSVKDCQPIAYANKPGNIPDVITLKSSLKQLESLGVDQAMVVTDCGFTSVTNIEEFFRSHMEFLTLVRISLKWVKDTVEVVLPQLGEFSTIYPAEPTVYGAVVKKEVEFNLTRKNSQEDKESVKRHMYIGVYRNTQAQKEEKERLYMEIMATKKKWEAGERQFDGPRKCFFDRYFTVSTLEHKKLLVNEKAFNDAVKYMGVFVLVSNKSMDAFEMLATYRLKEKFEEPFLLLKSKPRIQGDDMLKGCQFVQFMALGLKSFLLKRIKEVKESLMKIDRKCVPEEAALKRKLLSWLQNKSELQILQWFDCTEESTVRNKRGLWRWSQEIVQQDALFLKMLGIKV